MAMLISKFHRLIQSKLLWISFLVIVIFTFVIWGTQVPNTKDDARNASPGTLDGEPVPQQRFREAYFNTYLTVVMAVAQPLNITPQIDAQLRQAAWQRLASLNEAAKLGLGASDDEVAAAIQQHEGFSTEGRFNKAVYKSFVLNFLARMGFSERQFEEHVRQEIVLQKLRILIDRLTLVTPLELRRAFNSVTDQFTVDYVAIRPELVEPEVKVTREDARAFFDADPTAFTIPELVKVKYARIPVAPFLADAQVTDEEIEAYYDEHLREFRKETNDVAEADEAADAEAVAAAETDDVADVAAEADTEPAPGPEAEPAADDEAVTDLAEDAVAPAAEAATSVFDETNDLLSSESDYKPLEDVKDEIAALLRRRAALEHATEKAMNFVVALTPDRDGVAPAFEDAAGQFDLEVLQAGPFSAAEEIEGVDAGPAFNRAAFELTAGSEEYFSNPVPGSNAVYVLALEERIAERVPTFDEVEDEVLPVARRQALSDALTRKAQQVRDAADEALQSGRSFAGAVAAFGLTPEETKEFSSASGLQDDAYGDILLRGVLTRNRGELTELLPAEDAILLAHVRDRIHSDPATYDSLKLQLIATIRRQYGRISFDGWQDYLLRRADFRENRPAAVDEDVEDVDPEDAG